MTKVTKTIGKLPVFKDAYVQGRVYSRLNQVTHLGSTFQSKIDNNTSVPGEVVNNELVVNASWTVISNGTAAYLAGNRLTTVENRTEQLEQDVSVVRGGAKGLSGYNNVKDTTIQRNVTYEYWLIPDAGKLMIGSNSWLNVGFEIFAGECFFNNQKNQVRCGSYIVGAPLHLCYSINQDNVASWYMNGKKGSITAKEINDNLTADHFSNISTKSHILLHKRTINNVLLQQQVDQLYNQGRCDEVTLGDEWRRNFNGIMKTSTNLDCNMERLDFQGEKAVKITKKEGTTKESNFGIALDYINNSKSGYYELKFKMYIPSASTVYRSNSVDDCTLGSNVKSRLYDNVDVTNKDTWQDVAVVVLMSSSLPNSVFRAYFRKQASDNTPIYFSDTIAITSYDLLNEYLPQNLTFTKWIDTGINNQDITYTNPVFSYNKPYKQIQLGYGAPTTISDAMGQQYFDSVNGDLYISRAIPSPIIRQREVSDWGKPIIK